MVHQRELSGVCRPFGIIVLSILVGSILGALLGMKLMRKHFVKAGLAQ